MLHLFQILEMEERRFTKYSELRAFQSEYILRRNVKDTAKNDVDNRKKQMFIPEGSFTFIESQDTDSITIGFGGGCSNLFRNMWNRKHLTSYTINVENEKKVEITSVQSKNPSSRSAEFNPVFYPCSFTAKQPQKYALVVFGGKDAYHGFLSNELQILELTKDKTTFRAKIIKSKMMKQYPNLRNQLEQKGDIPSPRYAASMTGYLENHQMQGRVYCFGGITQPNFHEEKAYIDIRINPFHEVTEDAKVYELQFNIKTDEYTWKEMMFTGMEPKPRAFHTMTLNKEKLVVMGGIDMRSMKYLSLDPWILDLETKNSYNIQKNLPLLSNHCLLHQLSNRFISSEHFLVFGGISNLTEKKGKNQVLVLNDTFDLVDTITLKDNPPFYGGFTLPISDTTFLLSLGSASSWCLWTDQSQEELTTE